MARLFYLEHKMKVLLATSSPTPQLSSFFAKSMAETYAAGAKEDIEFIFLWSPDEFSFRNEAAELAINNDCDSVVFIKPHLQWVAEDLISILKNDSLIEGVPTKNLYSPQQYYKVILNEIKEDLEGSVNAKIIDLDFIKIKKEVFTRIYDFVIKANLVKEDIVEQIPLYFYSSADENGPMTQDINFCRAVEKAEIPIEINVNVAVFEHVWTPRKTFIGEDLRKDFVSKGFKEHG
jgi:hypothetical protein